MPTDLQRLEDQLRAALHERGDAITADRLRGDDRLLPIASTRRSRAARLAPYLAAAAVVAVVLALALVLRSGGPNDGAPAGADGTDLTGIKGHVWTMATVQAPDGGTTSIPASIGATVTFLGTGTRIAFQDGISAYTGRLTPTVDGSLEVHGIQGDFNLYGGNDPARAAAVAVTTALTIPQGGRTTVTIRLGLHDGELELDVQGYVVTLDHPTPVPPTASATPTTGQVVSTSAADAASSSPASVGGSTGATGSSAGTTGSTGTTGTPTTSGSSGS